LDSPLGHHPTRRALIAAGIGLGSGLAAAPFLAAGTKPAPAPATDADEGVTPGKV